LRQGVWLNVGHGAVAEQAGQPVGANSGRLRHEYTLVNLRFTIPVDPYNAALLARDRTEQAKRERGIQASNPFLRLLEPDIVESIRIPTGLAVRTRSESFEALRNWKDC
jgi:hydroxyacylglutathione hydrolase